MKAKATKNLLALLGILLGFWISVSFAIAAETPKVFNIEQQPLATALNQFAQQSDRQILFSTEVVNAKRTSGVKGELEPEIALRRLLKGTGLSFRVTADNTILVDKPGDTANVPVPQNSIRLAQVGGSESSSSSPEENKNPSSRDNEKKLIELEEIVVTGSHIRGASDTGSPVHVYTREDIDRAGIGSVKDFIQSLPQNFNGVANENTNQNIAGGNAAGQNLSAGSAVNLRGLGPDATLLLIDGHRVAPGNVLGNWSDISLIPLAAVERVEILTDGASAVYGSDAVGGVVNLIMRKRYSGAETRARYGFTSDGGGEEVQLGQTFGHEWTDGSAVLTYEYADREAVFAKDRPSTRAAFEPTTLLPSQVRHLAFASVEQRVTPGLQLFAEGNYASRESETAYATPFGFGGINKPRIRALSGILGGSADLVAAASLEASASYAKANTRVEYIEPFSGTVFPTDDTTADTTSIDVKIDGPLWSLGAGPLRYAVGGQYRRETFDTSGNSSSISGFGLDRDVYAGFIELNIPLIASAEEGRANKLDISLALRSEHYSDFGSTTNPKAGFAWQPSSAIKVRGTYGKSFRAPQLFELNPNPYNVVLNTQNDPLTGGTTNTLLVYGGNPDLGSERAEGWTLGLDITPPGVRGLSASATYYSTRYSDRISDITTAGCRTFSRALQCESAVGPTFIQRNPPLPLLEQIVASAAVFTNVVGAPLSSVGALVDSRTFNLSSLETHGIELDISYRTDLASGTFETGIGGIYILDFDRKLLPGSPETSIVSTPFNPVDMRFRARGLFARGNWSIAAFVNYVDSYEDNRVAPFVPVDSWATADMNIAYSFPQGGTMLNDLSISFAVSNLTDAEPPFIAGSPTFPGINFDGTNASVLGRVMAIQLSKNW